MIFDPDFFGIQGLTDEDRHYAGSRYADVRKAILENAYYQLWGAARNRSLPVYGVTLGRVLKGLFCRNWLFRSAAQRAIESRLDLRWGPDLRGYRRLLHPNAVCLFGRWLIDPDRAKNPYTGHFQAGTEAPIIARFSTCCTETRRGHYRSLSLVGKIFPTKDPDHSDLLETANFITQEDLGGSRNLFLDEIELRNAPDTTPLRRGFGLPILLLTGLAFKLVDNQIAHRQLYEVAELGKRGEEKTVSPAFMKLSLTPGQERVQGDELDFRDEVLGHIYEPGNPKATRKLSFDIRVTDAPPTMRGLFVRRRVFHDWEQIGRIEFHEGVASYNGDFVLQFHHPPWRNDRNDPSSRARPTNGPA